MCLDVEFENEEFRRREYDKKRKRQNELKCKHYWTKQLQEQTNTTKIYIRHSLIYGNNVAVQCKIKSQDEMTLKKNSSIIL